MKFISLVSTHLMWCLDNNKCDWIWQNPALTHRATLGDTVISSIYCIIPSWWIMLKEWKLQQVVVYSLAMIVWVNSFQTPEIQAALSSFFRVGIMIMQAVIIGVGGGGWAQYRSTKWNTKTIESQRSSLGPYRTFLVLTALQIEDNRHWPALRALQAPMQESHDHVMAPKCHSRLTQGLRKAATETRLMALEQGQQWNMIVYWASNPFLVKS